jgi:5'-nucleotidase
MEEVLGEFAVPLDGRFSSIRTSETNLGNFICDIMVNLK